MQTELVMLTYQNCNSGNIQPLIHNQYLLTETGISFTCCIFKDLKDQSVKMFQSVAVDHYSGVM